MIQPERNEAYKIFLNAWGKDMQMIMAIEELSELQTEIANKLSGMDNITSIIEEIADVEIMLEQIKYLFSIDKSTIDDSKEFNSLYHMFLHDWDNNMKMIMAIKEMSKLQKEVTKTLRGMVNRGDIIVKVTNVEIMIEQLKLMFKIDQNIIDEQKVLKINRALPKAKEVINSLTQKRLNSALGFL